MREEQQALGRGVVGVRVKEIVAVVKAERPSGRLSYDIALFNSLERSYCKLLS